MVKGNEFETGAVFNNKANPVFKQTKKMYLKEVRVLEVKPPAKVLIDKDGNIIFATAKYGKGSVFAVGDPWLYNEYTDGRKIPGDQPKTAWFTSPCTITDSKIKTWI